MTTYLFGYIEQPESWITSEEDISPIGDFCKEFEDYESCRKWVIKELLLRRKNIGKSVDLWLRRKPNCQNSLLQMSNNTVSSAPL